MNPIINIEFKGDYIMFEGNESDQNTDNLDYLLTLGINFFSDGEYISAKFFFESALKEKPDDPIVLNWLGKSF